jgi:type IV pilus assembly protein PilM
MQILPSSIRSIGAGLRPRLACEVRPNRVIAARSNDASGLIAAASSADLAPGALVPSLHPGNIADRGNFISALHSALDPLAGRTKDITLVVPDSAVRVLLLDFDALPSRLAEAIPVVRFRLKKLLPFEADDAGISYQIMSQDRSLVRVVAAAMPREVLDEYELAVHDAGYEPGAILPSTLASLTLLPHGTGQISSLIVNANPYAVTTAIVRGNVILLHRTLDFTAEVPALPEVRSEENAPATPAPPPVPIFATNLSEAPPVVTAYVEPAPTWDLAHQSTTEDESSPYPADTFDGSAVAAEAAIQSGVLHDEIEQEDVTANTAAEADVAQAVSIAAAYFEDTLNTLPSQILSAGTLDAHTLEQLLAHDGFDELMPNVREMVSASLLAADAASSSVPRSLLAGVAGALATGDTQS